MLNRALSQSSLLEKGLDAVWKKNEIIAANLANADTPGYKARFVDFGSAFSRALSHDDLHEPTQTDRFLATHSPKGQPGTVQEIDGDASNDQS